MKFLDYYSREMWALIKRIKEREQNFHNGKRIIKSIKTPTDLRRFHEILKENYGIKKKLQFEKIAEVTKDRKQENYAFFARLIATAVPLYVAYMSNDYLETSMAANIIAGASGVFGAWMAITLVSHVNSYREEHNRFKNTCCGIGKDLDKEQSEKMADLLKHCAYVERLEKRKSEKKATQEKEQESQEQVQK